MLRLTNNKMRKKVQHVHANGVFFIYKLIYTPTINYQN